MDFKEATDRKGRDILLVIDLSHSLLRRSVAGYLNILPSKLIAVIKRRDNLYSPKAGKAVKGKTSGTGNQSEMGG